METSFALQSFKMFELCATNDRFLVNLLCLYPSTHVIIIITIILIIIIQIIH